MATPVREMLDIDGKKINKAFLVETQYANSQVIFSTELMKLSKAIEECN